MLEKIVKVDKYTPSLSWTAEQVRRGDLAPNTPHYAKNPFAMSWDDWNNPPAVPQGEDEIVWISYGTGSWLRDRYVKS